eukprot:CAMPEP_0194237796 /NCGR_PEP_ID=MMETSP0158-20130606/4690_1 /TAXON_ID=33649 /ORGANISM="Thalassionema nitzschioides, Strain L26-B" /LENGTH=455 /DNA_ID=CAMNT_0038971899 /DNA_START=9 /DNA_END=1373 /DNA_ORIENTATION=+
MASSYHNLTVQQPKLRSFLFATILSLATAFFYDSSPNRPINSAVYHSPPATLRVGIAGAGAIAFGTAALLQQQQLEQQNHVAPMLWSPSGRCFLDEESNNLSAMFGEEEEDALLFRPRIATNAKQLVQENDVILIALPANGHKQVFDELSPFLGTRKDQQIIISSHMSLGALYLSQQIISQGGTVPPITAWGTTVCTARSLPPGKHRRGARINTVRKSVDLCTIPSEESSGSLKLCQQLFPNIEFRPRNGLLAISLSNVNPQNHLGIALGNMSRMEKGEQWYQLFHVTPNIGRLLETLDQERLEIAKELQVTPVKTIHEHFSNSFHVPIMDSISDMNQEIYASRKDVYGPDTADSRYITEDVPYGLALTVLLGKLVQKPAVLHEAGILILSSMYGRNFFDENDLLNALALDEYSLEELKAAAYSGRLVGQQSQLPTAAATRAQFSRSLKIFLQHL